MSTAWETTTADIATVLEKHGLKLNKNKINKIHDDLDHDKIESNVLLYTDMDDQTNSMLDDIENYLLENKIITGEKKFTMVGEDNDDDFEIEVDEDDLDYSQGM